jgi:hypothetical protein
MSIAEWICLGKNVLSGLEVFWVLLLGCGDVSLLYALVAIRLWLSGFGCAFDCSFDDSAGVQVSVALLIYI